ncbi:MAG TPA: exodeoxyribonuclease VII small subunit [Candidatus Binataceae bacterium]|nr:exodeoxyribonuclease VII small subunit [Candidatus Binataceae bacterium]
MATTRRKFEDELKDLEGIVGQIDSGELSLEDSIAAFERGVGLVRSLNQKLDEVERKVELLMRNAQGELKNTPYDPTAAGGESGNKQDHRQDDHSKGGHKKDDEDIPF